MKARTILRKNSDGEFLWLVSLSDMMILLFVFFVVLFTFSYQKLSTADIEEITSQFDKSKNHRRTFDEIQAKLLKWVVEKKLMSNVEITQKEDSLIIQIKEGLLFDSGQAGLKETSHQWMEAVGSVLQRVPAPYRIGIEGHTDDTPVRGPVVDNWGLSALRALSVLRALHLPPEQEQRTVVMGYGEMKPLKPNRSENGETLIENQKTNRRVVIRIF